MTFESQQGVYHRNLVRRAAAGRPKEDIVYGVFTEFVLPHKISLTRFTIYPQMRLNWKPADETDRRSEVPDLGVGNFTLPGSDPLFKLRCGVEAKRPISTMATLPAPGSLINDRDTLVAFHGLYIQAQDQAKAAYKNQYPLREDGVNWILLVGPYWTPEVFGPFSEAESTVRGHKVSDSADYEELAKVLDALHGPPRPLKELYLLDSNESFHRLGGILQSTDSFAQPYINAMSSCTWINPLGGLI